MTHPNEMPLVALATSGVVLATREYALMVFDGTFPSEAHWEVAVAQAHRQTQDILTARTAGKEK